MKSENKKDLKNPWGGKRRHNPRIKNKRPEKKQLGEKHESVKISREKKAERKVDGFKPHLAVFAISVVLFSKESPILSFYLLEQKKAKIIYFCLASQALFV